MIKRDTAWVVVNASGHLIVSTVRLHRRTSIGAMVGHEAGQQKRWAYWKRLGCRCIRVRLVPEADSGGDRG